MVRKPIQLANLGMLKMSLVNLMGYSVAPIARCLDVLIIGGTLHLCGRLNRHVETRALYARTDVRGARTDARVVCARELTEVYPGVGGELIECLWLILYCNK
jgi:hypothetical protein